MGPDQKLNPKSWVFPKIGGKKNKMDGENHGKPPMFLMDDLGGKTPLFLGNIPNPMKNKNRLSPFVFGRKLCSYVASVRYFDKKKAVTMIDVTVFTHS